MRFRRLAGTPSAFFLVPQNPPSKHSPKHCTRPRRLAEGSHIVGAPCTGHGGLLDQFQLWDIEGSTPAPAPTPSPPTPCGKPCKEDKDCNGKGGFFGNTCLVSGTRCAGHCAKRD